ncbi:MAG: hypothetical protein ACP5N3_04635 [Candidatus Nanoarchaeia archaeon]
MKTQKTLPKKENLLLDLLGLVFVSFIAITLFTTPVKADPAGATISNNITSTAATYTPDDRADAGGTITTMVLTAVQQDDKWKAYVGNISGSLTLDDSNGFTIYSWALGASEVTGELYVSRDISVAWANINCSSNATMNAEETFLGINSASVDSINRTFNETTHDDIFVAGLTIGQNTCRSTATYVNDTAQSIAAADFPVVLLASGSDVVFTSPLNQNTLSYRNDSNVDFQIIVPDDVTTASTTYYFYVEIGS